MGRLTKARIDKVRKLRDEGYTQKEVSEKVGVDIKTVRKYDSQKLTSKIDVQENEARFSDLVNRIRWLEENMREMGFGKMFGCHFHNMHYLIPGDEENGISICKQVVWGKKPEALQTYHGPLDDEDHYHNEPHTIKVEGKWYRMPSLEECISCSSFYPKEL